MHMYADIYEYVTTLTTSRTFMYKYMYARDASGEHTAPAVKALNKDRISVP